eukprot:Skav233215  [mRNA]  locus=scaffold3062:112466:115663:- [translate_table: standard]
MESGWTSLRGGKVLVNFAELDKIEGLAELDVQLSRCGIMSKKGGLFVATPAEVDALTQAVSGLQDVSPLVRAFLTAYKIQDFSLAQEMTSALKANAAKSAQFQSALQRMVNSCENVETPNTTSLMGISTSTSRAFLPFSRGQASMDTRALLWLLAGAPRKAETATDSCAPNVTISGSTRMGQPFDDTRARDPVFKLTLTFAKVHVGKIIGTQGATMKSIKEATNAKVEAHTAFDPCVLTAIGSLDDVETVSRLSKQALNITDPTALDEDLSEVKVENDVQIEISDKFQQARQRLLAADAKRHAAGNKMDSPLSQKPATPGAGTGGIDLQRPGTGTAEPSSKKPDAAPPLPAPDGPPPTFESDDVPLVAPSAEQQLSQPSSFSVFGNPLVALERMKKSVYAKMLPPSSHPEEPEAKRQRKEAQDLDHPQRKPEAEADVTPAPKPPLPRSPKVSIGMQQKEGISSVNPASNVVLTREQSIRLQSVASPSAGGDVANDGTDDGTLSEIRRLYVQDGVVIGNAPSTIPGVTGSAITDAFCNAQRLGQWRLVTFWVMGLLKD